MQAYPFRMTAQNMAKHRNNPNIAFWRMLKEGNDHFEVTHQEPKVDVCEKRYVFDAGAPANASRPLAFNAARQVPGVSSSIRASPTRCSTSGGTSSTRWPQYIARDVADGADHAPASTAA